jgi:hypothetical protein
MELVYFSETLVSTYKCTRRYNPEDQHRQLHRREKLKSHTVTIQIRPNYIQEEIKIKLNSVIS